MPVAAIEQWFHRIFPDPQPVNFNTQLGVHVEEIAEMFEAVSAETEEQKVVLESFTANLRSFSDSLKQGTVKLTVRTENRVRFLDAICDQVVTGIGAGALQKMLVEPALTEVSASNYSKFGEDGLPIFNDHNKVMKGPNYRKPELHHFV